MTKLMSLIRKLSLIAPFLTITAMAEALQDRLVGAWTLNIKESQLLTPLQSQLMTVTKIAPDTVRVDYEEILETGVRRTGSKQIICDGSEHRVEGTKTGRTQVCDPGTLNIVAKQDRIVLNRMSISFSQHGNTHTVRRVDLDPKGRTQAEYVFVHERK